MDDDRHPERRERLSGEGRKVYHRLNVITFNRGNRPAGPDRFVERLALTYAPNVVGLRALTIRAPRRMTLISAPASAFYNRDQRCELETLTKIARESGRRALLVPTRTVTLRWRRLRASQDETAAA